MDPMLLCPGKSLVLPNLHIDQISVNTRFLLISLPNNCDEADLTSPQLLRTPRPCRQSCGNSSLCINSWKGSSELGPRRHKRRINNVFCLLPIR
ncbi:hypothetical protein TNCV_4547811 [Trichonephila clavipes]|nr:hypothetical protein TNCV_4547811 [Trichonephila clavipes]